MRIHFIDNVKALAILLVLIGHTDGIPQYLENFIYSFHMPIFFFISGYLMKNYKLELKLKDFARLQLKSLVVPYIFFGLVSLCYSFLNDYVKGNEIHVLTKIFGFLYGNADGLTNIVLWFFTCLFTTSIVFWALFKIMPLLWIVIFSLGSALIISKFGHYIIVRPPWNLDLSLIALFFYAFGKMLSEKIDIQLILKKKFFLLAVIFIIMPILLYSSNLNGRIDMAFLVFKNPILFILNSSLGIAILFLISMLLPNFNLFQYLSKNTIVIFPLHPIIFSIFTGVAMIAFKMPHSFQNNIIWTGFYVLGAIILCYPISLLLFRWFPIVIGGRKA